jgi:uncharacterized protein YuzE
MKISYDKQSDALYLNLSRGKVQKTLKVNSRMMVDVGERGKVVGVEFLFVSEKMPKSFLRTRSVRLPARRAQAGPPVAVK